MTRWAAAAALLFAAGCRTAGVGESTATAMAIPGGTPQAVADLLTRAMLNRGYQVRSVDGRQALFARPADTAPGGMLVAEEQNGSPETRVRYDIANVKGGVHVTAVIQLVTNPGKKYEHASLPNGGEDFAKVQEVLTAIRDRIARRPPQAAKPEAAKAAETPKRSRVKRSEPAPDDKPTPRTAAEEDNEIEQMRKRALGNR